MLTHIKNEKKNLSIMQLIFYMQMRLFPSPVSD